MKVLLVEIDHVVRDRIKVAFQQIEGCTVDTAEDAWALELQKENAYDVLVIADTLMDQGDGIRILKDLRDAGLTGPVILLSRGGADAETAAKEREGVNAAVVLTVPPDTIDIFKAVLAAQQRVAPPSAA
jgi:DNA-binding NarL/FixJ family response regulator